MVAKRLLAVVVAAGLIVAAVLIRGQVIEGDDGPDEPDPTLATKLVCVPDLVALCDAVAETAGLTTRNASSATMPPPSDEMWLTLAPLPETVGGYTSTTLASSRLALVTKRPDLNETCADVDWRCLADNARALKLAFAPLDTAIGQVSVAAAVRGFFGTSNSIDPSDLDFIVAGPKLKDAVNPEALSALTPIATVQTARPLVGVAVGADAEVINTRRDEFQILYAAPMTRVDLVLAAPDGVEVPDQLVDALRTAAEAAGWEQNVQGEPPSAGDLQAAVAAWSAL